MSLLPRVGLAPLLLLGLALAARADTGRVLAEPSWEELRAVYDYDTALPLDAEPATSPPADGQLHHIVFSSTNAQRVTALIGLPSAARYGPGPYPAIVIGHGLGGSKDDLGFRMAAQFLLSLGYAAVAIDYANHGERRTPEQARLGSISEVSQLTPELGAMLLAQLPDGARQSIVDLRRSVDLLESMPQVDSERIGFAGASLGAVFGVVFAAVEPRIAVGVFLIGGADWTKILAESEVPGLAEARAAGTIDPVALGRALRESDPLWFAPHLTCPSLLVFGADDNVIPYEPCGRLLSELAGGDKTVTVLDNWIHGSARGPDTLALIGMVQRYLLERFPPSH